MEHIQSVIKDACARLYGADITPELTRPEAQFGDLATNVALQLAKPLGKNSRELAEELSGALRESLVDMVTEVTIAGPGFINLRLTDQALLSAVDTHPREEAMAGKTVLVEYSDPNPFKPLHAGHLYTTLVGDTIARLIERSGATVVRLNYGGDVGLHVGKSIWAIIRHLGGELPERLEDIPGAERPAWLGERYVEGNTAYEDDEQAKDEIVAVNKRVYELHEQDDHDSAFARIYWTCRQWSYDYFSSLYEQLEVVPFDRYIPESEVTPLGLETVRQQADRGVYKESDGAIIFEGEAHNLHTRVFINSAGLPTYETKDVGLLLTKWRDYSFDSSIVITSNEQSQYFQVMLKSVEQFAPEPAQRSVHLTHGSVKLQGGLKMSSRKGNVVMALDILEAARRAASGAGIAANEETILAAVKYAFAKNRIGGDIMYHPEESIALEGNSGPYLQYAHARARSILAKAPRPTKPEVIELQTGERTLVRKLTEYSTVVDRAITELMPHHIGGYLYELAQEFNRFYEQHRVLGDKRQTVRLWLVETYADVLKDGLTLLGIAAPDRM
jgi:arginyl-tRNA synthetase